MKLLSLLHCLLLFFVLPFFVEIIERNQTNLFIRCVPHEKFDSYFPCIIKSMFKYGCFNLFIFG